MSEIQHHQKQTFSLSQKQIKQIEEWTSLQFGEIIFDSTKDNWSQHSSLFDSKLVGKKQLLFLIEDNEGEIFGYYFNTLMNYNFNNNCFRPTDNKSFEFNIRSNNNRLTSMLKFPIKDTCCGYFLFDKSCEMLVSLGGIYLWKENYKDISTCIQNEDSYEYHGIENAVCGKTNTQDNEGCWKGEHFVPKTIQVIQMKMTEEQIQFEKQKEEKRMKQLEEWTGLKCGEIIFDSDVDKWSMNESVLNEKIEGRKRLVFTVVDDYGEQFGYYLNTQIENVFNSQNYLPTDNKSFEFNLESNGRLKKPMKFPIKDTEKGYQLKDKKDIFLILLGNMVIFKEGQRNLSYYMKYDNYYDYQRIENLLYGKVDENNKIKTYNFIPMRIKVIQMEMTQEEKK